MISVFYSTAHTKCISFFFFFLQNVSSYVFDVSCHFQVTHVLLHVVVTWVITIFSFVFKKMDYKKDTEVAIILLQHRIGLSKQAL